jgi:hypothetical protein
VPMALQPLVCETGFEAGFWWNNSIVAAVADGTTDPASLVAIPCPRSESCLVSDSNRSVCIQGHTGIVCAQCASGFGMSTGGICGECFDPGESFQLPFGRDAELCTPGTAADPESRHGAAFRLLFSE